MVVVFIIASILSVSQHIKTLEKDNIIGRYQEGANTASDALYKKATDFGAEAIIVPGAAILSDKTPSPVLRARLDVAVDLYDKNVARKILLTGDGDNAHVLAGAVGQHDGAAHLLVRVTAVNAQAHMQLDRFVELRLGGLAAQRQGLFGVVQFCTVDKLFAVDIMFTVIHNILLW